MNDYSYGTKSVLMSELHQKLEIGDILRDCSLRCVDKIANLKFDKTVIYSTKLLEDSVWQDSRISGIICNEAVSRQVVKKHELGIWVYHDPQDLFFRIHEALVDRGLLIVPWKNSISEKAQISPRAMIGDHSITIGDDCVVEDGAVIHPFTIIGNGSRVGSLCDIGSDGFEVHVVNGQKKVIKHGGLVIIGENVEVLQMVKIARGLSPSRNTEIRDNVKIDSLTHIAHGVIIEPNTIITGGVTIAGNTNILENAYVGPGAIISNRIILGQNSYASIGSVVISNLKKGMVVSGNFAVDHQDNLTRHLYLKNQIKRNN